jgi:HK97 family phage portal protein
MATIRQRFAGFARAIKNEVLRISTPWELAEALRRRDFDEDVGFDVTTDSAMRSATVYSCVRVLSEDIAALPLNLYRRTEKGREKVTNHWLAQLLRRPNNWQTGFEFREMQQAHIELAGEFLAIKSWVGKEVRELLPVVPSRWRVEQQNDWTLKYSVLLPGKGDYTPVPLANVYHVRGLSLDGVRGVSPIEYQRRLIGTSIALAKRTARMFKNGALIGGVLEHPGELSPEAAKRLKDSFDEQYSGVDNAGKTLLLEEGAKFNKTGMTAEEAQFLDINKYKRSEICGLYRVPPHMIADLERATFSNIEQQATGYLVFGLVPRLRRIETRMAESLVSLAERDTLYVEHDVDMLQRGDYKTRMAGYKDAVSTGWMSRNEVRQKENMNAGPPKLDEFLDPAFLTGKQDPQDAQDPSAASGGDA